jgi:hypothetical protein
MHRISSWLLAAKLAAIVVAILPVSVFAQSFWLERSNGKTFLLEIFKPVGLHPGPYNGAYYYQARYYSLETFAFFLSLRSQIGSRSFLMVELPFAHATVDKKIDREFSFFRLRGYWNTIGNPYIGLELGGPTSRFFTEVGIRLPLVKTDNNYAARVGEEADYDRYEAFAERYVVAKAMVNYRSNRTKGLTFRARVGAMILRDIDRSGDKYPGLLDWFRPTANAQVGYETARMSLGVNLGLGFTANVRLGNLRPGVYINPSFLDATTTTFGLNLGLQP